MSTLPAPETVLPEAIDVTDRTAANHDDPDAINVVVAGTASAEDITLDDGGYHGVAAGDVGRLAAATHAVETGGGQLHAPVPEYTAAGPWVVVDALGGRLATVAKGKAMVTVTLTPPAGHLDARITELQDALVTLLDAARPTHDIYPVDRDELGVFTTGLPTFELIDVTVEAQPTVTFAASTTPATSVDDLDDRFRQLEPVESVTAEMTHGVERADPPPWLRAAAERAANRVFGDWEYEWLPGPGQFTWLPDASKLAVGTGGPDDETFTTEAYDQLRRLLQAILAEDPE